MIYFAYSFYPPAVAHTNSSLIAVLSPVEHRDFIFSGTIKQTELTGTYTTQSQGKVANLIGIPPLFDFARVPLLEMREETF